MKVIKKTLYALILTLSLAFVFSVNVKAGMTYEEFREYSVKFLKEFDVERTIHTFAYDHDFYHAFCSEAPGYYTKYLFLTCDIEEYFKDSISDYYNNPTALKKDRPKTYSYMSNMLDAMNPVAINMIFVSNGQSSLTKSVYDEVCAEDPDLSLTDKLNRTNYCVNFLITNNISNVLVYNSWKNSSGCTIYKVLKPQIK